MNTAENYSNTSGSLWNYYRDEPNSGSDGNINYFIKDSTSFDYKTSITGKLENNNVEKEGAETVVPVKYLSNFWKALDMPLIHCKVSLTLTWSANCVLTTKSYREDYPDANPAVAEINDPANATFKTKDTKLYVRVVTLSAQDDNKLLEQLETRFKRIIKWNKCRSEISNQTKNKNLNYLIDPTFTKVNRLYFLSFKNEDDRTSFSKYYTPSVKIKDFNVLTDAKRFFDTPIKNKEESYEKIIEMSRNNDYTASNVLDYEHFLKHYKLIVIDLSKKTEFENLDLKQQINFIGRSDEDNATMFSII